MLNRELEFRVYKFDGIFRHLKPYVCSACFYLGQDHIEPSDNINTIITPKGALFFIPPILIL